MWRWGGGEGEKKQIQSWSPEKTKHYWKKKTFATDWLRRVRVRRGEGGSSSRQRGLSQRLANNLLQVTCKPKARDLQTCKCELCIIHLHFYIQLAVLTKCQRLANMRWILHLHVNFFWTRTNAKDLQRFTEYCNSGISQFYEPTPREAGNLSTQGF